MKKKLTVNYFYSVIYQVISLITPIITAPYLARTLMETSIGINNYTYSIVYWFYLIGTIGIKLYGNNEIAKVRDNKEKLNQKFSEILFLQITSYCISLILFFGIFSFFNYDYKTVLLIQGVYIISGMLDISWFYYGLEEFKIVTIRDLIVKFLNILFIFIFVKKPNDLTIFVIASVFFNVLGQLLMWINLRSRVKIIKIKFSKCLNNLKPSLILFLPQISAGLFQTIDQTMLGYFSNVEEVAYYGQAQRFVHMFLFLTTTMGVVMLPRLSNLKANNDIETIGRYNKMTFKMALMIAYPLIFGLSAVSLFFIPYFLTSKFITSAYLIIILSPTIFFISCTNFFGLQILVPDQELKKYNTSIIAGVVINIIINFVLIKYIASYGAAIASVMAELVVFIFQYNYIRKKYNFNREFKESLIYLLSSIIMFLIVFPIGIILGGGIYTSLIQIVVGVITYFAMLYVFREKLFIAILTTIMNTIKVKNKSNN